MTTKPTMFLFATAVLAAGLSMAAAAQPNEQAATVEGTWNMTLMSHQMALELKQNGTKVTGVFMIMGKDVAVEGQFVGRALSLTGIGAKVGEHNGAEVTELKLTAKLLEDDTLEGEMTTARGPAKWTAERLGK
jgi:hypothetical protein